MIKHIKLDTKSKYIVLFSIKNSCGNGGGCSTHDKYLPNYSTREHELKVTKSQFKKVA